MKEAYELGRKSKQKWSIYLTFWCLSCASLSSVHRLWFDLQMSYTKFKQEKPKEQDDVILRKIEGL